MAAKNEKQLTRHLAEVVRVLKVLTTRLARWYPSEESREVADWCVRELDKLAVELERE